MNKRLSAFLVNLLVMALLASCGLLPQQPTPPAVDLAATNQVLQATVDALAAQATSDAMAKLIEPTQTASPEPTFTTAPTDTPEPTALPSETPLPTDTPTPEATPTANAVELTRQLEARIKASNVLVYEEADAQGRLVPRLGKALAGMKFSGGVVVDATNYLGTFDRQLKNNKWDLVVMSIQSRDRVELGSLGVINAISDHVSSGGAFILETWNLDEDQSAMGGLALSLCNASVEKDWNRPDNFNYSEFVIPAFKPDSMLFNTPNKMTLPLNPTTFWKSDVGDLIRLEGGGGSSILAGLLSSDPTNYGLLTSCQNGRMLLQTFSTHDYSQYDTTRLWQNMMYYTLYNHFNSNQ